MNIRVRLLFDLDGTISDPGIGITRSLNHALVSFGRAPREEAELKAYIGPPLDEAFCALAGLSTLEEVQPYVAKYRERYSSVGYRENVLYDGVSSALERLHAAGIRMAVCTSKRADIADRVLEMFELRRFFCFVDGGEVGIKKWQQIERLKDKKLVDERTVMVGDRAVDIEAARKNGLLGAGVLWGYGTGEEIVSAKPDYVVHTPGELDKLIRNG